MTLWEQFDLQVYHFGTPLVVFLGIFLLGIIIDRWVIGRVRRFAQRTRWAGSDLVVAALSGITTLMGAIIGARVALPLMPIQFQHLDMIKQAFDCASILVMTWLVERVVSAAFEALSGKETSGFPTTTIFSNIVKVSIYIFGVLIALHSLGISIAPIVTALGIGGLAVALALKDTLSNLFAGIQVIVSRQLNIGDYVFLGQGQEGHIVDITWRNTTIRALSNSMVIVPNAIVASGVITNFGKSGSEFSFSIPMKVSYDSDVDQMESMIRDVIKNMQNEFPSKMPSVVPGIKYAAFGESGLELNVSLRVYDFECQFEMRHEFVKRMHLVMGSAGVHIPFPTREIHHKIEGGVPLGE
jgi:small-conductance mechanosensitive channel